MLVLSSCEKASQIGTCTDDPGDGSIVVSAKPTTIFSNGSQDLWQTQLADWQDTTYYTNGEDLIIKIDTRNSSGIDAHGNNTLHPCNICSKIVKYNPNGSIYYQTPNCICGPKIYISPTKSTQSFRYYNTSKELFAPIETTKPECEVVLGYLEKAHYDIIDNNERVVCSKGASNEIIEISATSVNIKSPLSKTNINSQEYTCIPMEWALNLGAGHPNFTTGTNLGINNFLNQNYIKNGKYYSKATHLLTADFKNITDENRVGGYEIVHFPQNYYEKELKTTETDQAKITTLKDVNYHNVTSCSASSGFNLYLGLFPQHSDMPGYNGKIYAYHLYSFNQICSNYRKGVCEKAVTSFKLSTSNPDSILPNSFLDNTHNPITIPPGYKIKFKIYDNFYTDNKESNKYYINISSGIQTQNYAKKNQDEGAITHAKQVIDAINKNGLIRATYENFTVKNITIIRLILALFLLFYGASYLMGLSEINQKELIIRIFKIGIVFAFLDPSLVNLATGKTVKLDPATTMQQLQNNIGYSTLGFYFYQKYLINIVLEGLNYLLEIVTNFSKAFNFDGTSRMLTEVSLSSNVNFAYFDKILEKIFSIKTLGAIVSAVFTKWLIGAVLLIVLLYFLVKTIFKLLMTYILNWLQILLALSLGPIFFLFLLFSKTKGFFTKWIAFTFARALDIVILVALTFPFISIVYTDLLAILGEHSCLRPIGPSFLKIAVWIQGDNSEENLNNFFGYIFALARAIALVYITSLIASYAPEISGKIINIADNQNTAGNSKAASNLASQTTNEALKTLASGIKFANSSYIAGMAKSYIKNRANSFAQFAKKSTIDRANSFAQFAKKSTIDTAMNIGSTLYKNITGKKNVAGAGATGAGAATPTVAGATGAGTPIVAASPTAGAGTPIVAGAGAPIVAGAGTPIVAGAGAPIVAGTTGAGDATAPVGVAPTDATTDNLLNALKTQVDNATKPIQALKPGDIARKQQEMMETLQTLETGIKSLSQNHGLDGSTQNPIQPILTKTPQAQLEDIKNNLQNYITDPQFNKTYPDVYQQIKSLIKKIDQQGTSPDTEAKATSGRTFEATAQHKAAPPSTPVYKGQEQQKSQQSQRFTDTSLFSDIKQKFETLYNNSQLQEFKKQLTIDNALDLFIKANNTELKKLQQQFKIDQSNDNINLELERVFAKFTADFTSINQSMSKIEIATKIVANDNKLPQTSDETKQNNFSQIATKLAQENMLQELQQQLRNQDNTKKQEALVKSLAEADSDRLKQILEERKKETKDQARINHLQEIFSQAERTKAFTQYYTEPDTSAVSLQDLTALKDSDILSFNEEERKNITQYQELLQKSPNLENSQDVSQLTLQAEVEGIALNRITQAEEYFTQNTPIEELESQKKLFDTILKLIGVKYKSDRDQVLNFLFNASQTGDTTTDLQHHFDRMYISLEKPLTKMKKKYEILEKLLESTNSDIEKKLAASSQDSEGNNKLQANLEENNKKLARIKQTKGSFKSLFAKIEKATQKS